jgi:hypothetical protein
MTNVLELWVKAIHVFGVTERPYNKLDVAFWLSGASTPFILNAISTYKLFKKNKSICLMDFNLHVKKIVSLKPDFSSWLGKKDKIRC